MPGIKEPMKPGRVELAKAPYVKLVGLVEALTLQANLMHKNGIFQKTFMMTSNDTVMKFFPEVLKLDYIDMLAKFKMYACLENQSTFYHLSSS